ncbi:MAG TPA: DUF4446 family protein [Solirubrobacteraceae bacterium]|nr:DUF4446 family protein [Solirubrobacteraceae bacterium]
MTASTAGIVAIAAAAVAAIALAAAARALLALRRLRAAQRVVLGDHGRQDLVAHAAALHEAFGSLHAYVEDVAARLDRRLGTAEDRLDGAVSFAGLVHYDAMNEMSGRQSTSIALLDARMTGIVLSSIHHRDQARLYAKLVRGGHGELELSPEEAEAIRRALEPPAAGSEDRGA